MPSVRDLDGIGGAPGGRVGEGPGAVSADDLYARVHFEPLLQCLRLPVGQQVHQSPPLPVDQHGAIAVAPAPREVVHPQHPRRTPGGGGLPAHLPQ
jgi:hypothetical protein